MSIEKRDDKFVARVRVDGKGKQATFTTRGEAKAWERRTLEDARRGEYVDPNAGRITFAAYTDTWLDQQAIRWRESTERHARSTISKHLTTKLGHKHLGTLKRSDCQAVINEAVANLKPRTTHNVRRFLGAILDSAVEDGLIRENPAAKLTMPKLEGAPVTPLTDSQVAMIADSIRPELRAFVILGAASGMRSGEMRALRADDFTPALHVASQVPPAQVTIRVRRGMDDRGVLGPPKSPAANRDVTVTGAVAQVLIEHVQTYGLNDDGLVFHLHGRVLQHHRIAMAWREATDGMGFDAGHGPHQLRHHHASKLLAAGINIAAVSRRLGHANANVTLRTYSHVMAGDEDKILSVLTG